MVTILVGGGDNKESGGDDDTSNEQAGNRELKIYQLHEDLVVANSDFFKVALTKGWKESDEHILRLPEDSPEIFEIFFWFLYTGKVACRQHGDKDTVSENGKVHDPELERLQGAWILGEKLQASDFKDSIVDALIARMTTDEELQVDIHEEMYPSSGLHSPLRRLLVDFAVWIWSFEAFEVQCLHKDSAQFFLDVAVAFARKEKEESTRAPFDKNTCHYHEHTTKGTECYKTKFTN